MHVLPQSDEFINRIEEDIVQSAPDGMKKWVMDKPKSPRFDPPKPSMIVSEALLATGCILFIFRISFINL